MNSWYWGRGNLGPYYLVWFDGIDKTDVEHANAYVVKYRRVVGSTCDKNGVRVRPVDAPYPPSKSSKNPSEYSITMTLHDGTEILASVEVKRTQAHEGSYARWIGTLEGTVAGEHFSGSAVWEQFNLFKLDQSIFE